MCVRHVIASEAKQSQSHGLRLLRRCAPPKKTGLAWNGTNPAKGLPYGDRTAAECLDVIPAKAGIHLRRGVHGSLLLQD